MRKNLKILAIESSCDDSCVSIIEAKKDKFKILSNLVSSQAKLHAQFGGVWPTLAKREHQKNLVSVLFEALKEAKLLKKRGQELEIDHHLKKILKKEPILAQALISFLKKYQKPKLDSIALTIGPGLEPCLWVGVNLARALSYFWKLPIVEINHIEAHLLINFLENPLKMELFPAIGLVVSGGHTQLILIKKIGKYKILGETRDDAAGECFDKVARILNLGYPGGPAIAAQAARAGQILQIDAIAPNGRTFLPRPMIKSKDYDFSFSGLKTAVLYLVKKIKAEQKKLTKTQIQMICKETQQAVIEVLIKKTIRAAKNFKTKSILLGGGVVANQELRDQFQLAAKKMKIKLLIPDKLFCTDNAAMVGVSAYFYQKKKKSFKKIKAQANLRI